MVVIEEFAEEEPSTPPLWEEPRLRPSEEKPLVDEDRSGPVSGSSDAVGSGDALNLDKSQRAGSSLNPGVSSDRGTDAATPSGEQAGAETPLSDSRLGRVQERGEESHSTAEENRRLPEKAGSGTGVEDSEKHLEGSGLQGSGAVDEGATGDAADGEDEVFEDALSEEDLRKRATAEAEENKAEGNALYKTKDYAGALEKYANALELLPEHEETKEARATYHSNSAICHLQVGEYEAAVKASSAALELKPAYVKALLRRAQAQEHLDHLEEALADLNKVLELDPGDKAARANAMRLEPIVAEKREKLKEEMLGKLKDLGNSLLGHFGMSMDNFKAVQDPATGSYSINFQQ